MRQLATPRLRLLRAGVVCLLILLESVLIGLFPSRVTLTSLAYGLGGVLVIPYHLHIVRSGPGWQQRLMGDEPRARVAIGVVTGIVAIAFEGVILYGLLITPWWSETTAACVCADAGGLKHALALSVFASVMGLMAGYFLAGIDACALVLAAAWHTRRRRRGR